MDIVGDISGIICSERATCEEMTDGIEVAFVGDDLLHESRRPMQRSKSNPNTARNAHIVPGGLNGGGKELMTLCSRRVAAITDTRAIDDARVAAVIVGQVEVLVVGSMLVDS